MSSADTEGSDPESEEMRPEYDFTGGVRGKHYQGYQEGHSVVIHRSDGVTLVQNYTLEPGAVLLAPDVQEYFPDADSVNRALRQLIALIPKKRETVEAESE